MIGCGSDYLALAAGAAASLSGVDTILPLPRIVHWAAAGAATDMYCRGEVYPTFDNQYFMCLAGGAAGGLAVSYLRASGYF